MSHLSKFLRLQKLRLKRAQLEHDLRFGVDRDGMLYVIPKKA